MGNLLINPSILTRTDSYKITHWKQYPPGTEKVYSYLEARSNATYEKTLFFGLQYFLKKYLVGNVVTKDNILEAKEFTKLHLGSDKLFNEEGWKYILDKYEGKLPVEIKAVPEGTLVNKNNVLVTIENTDPKCFWLTNYLETLLVQVWYPSTVATISYYVKECINNYLRINGTPEQVKFKLHDFGFRGVSSIESAGIGGLAHLVNFSGTDTIEAIICGMKYYDSGVCGFSIPASEHSTITSWGADNEVDAFANMLVQYPEGLVACVSDSFDIEFACSELWGTRLKDKVLNRNGTLVIRPDSGNIVSTVLNVLTILGKAFGTYINDKGFKVLNDKIRVIQGDGCNPFTIKNVLQAMSYNDWSADNIAFGMGGGLLQKLNRDTQSFAFKCSSITINGHESDVFKAPIGDKNKTSKAGKLVLYKNTNGNYVTTKRNVLSTNDLLRLVYKNGELLIDEKFNVIRLRAETN